MEYENILTRRTGNVGVIQFNRPKAMNALNEAMARELIDAAQAFDAEPDIGAIVLTGSARAFAAGADISEMVSGSATDFLKADRIGIWDQLRAIRKPIVAAVSGYALGGGCEIALACDMIVASETAIFGQPEVKLGVIPGAGGTQRLALALGKALTMEMVLSDRRLTAQEALRFGLVNRVVPVEHFLDESIDLAQTIAEQAPLAVQLAKEAVNHAFEMTLTEGLAFERKLFYYLFATEDQKEGMQAFLEKRAPRWKGR
ncbi:MAG: enoyl-CoA hydratase [Chloroflexi bacterium]|nr:enoyl-CoA hydratase [Chloroflexota bacterium]